MPRAILLSLTIVAAFQTPLAAAPPASYTEAPAGPRAVAAAQLLRVDLARDPSRFLHELTRLLYTPPEGKSPASTLLRGAQGGGLEPAARFDVWVPLSPAVWSDAVFRRTVTADDLVDAIIADRRAALLAYGLTGLDEETLAFLATEPSILARLYERGAAAFAAFGSALRIRGGRIVPPGGDPAVPLWEAAIQQSVSQPGLFVRALYGEHEGRLAYLFDVIAQLDPPAARFAIGAWLPDETDRRDRFQELAAAIAGQYSEWRPTELPFSRPMNDLATMLLRIRLLPSGAPAAPASRTFWASAFSGGDVPPTGAAPDDAASALIDAAWIANATGNGDVYARGDRLEQFAFGQRAFAHVAGDAWLDALTAVQAYPKQRMLMLALERMGVTSAATYAAASRRAARMGGDPSRAFWTLAQLQGALAIVARLTSHGVIDPATASALVESVSAVPLEGDRYLGAMAEWLDRHLLPLLGAGPSSESRIVAGLAGPAPGEAAPRVSWEGQEYRLDFAAAEVRRIQAIRRKHDGYTVDTALALHAAARVLMTSSPSQADVDVVRARLTALADGLPRMSRTSADLLAPGVQAPRSAADVLRRVVDELDRSGARDARRVGRQVGVLRELVDMMLGEALISLAYAAAIGDPDGAPMLARNVALRHDFGLERRDGRLKERAAWDIPRPDFRPGLPWHITGSVLGLELALAQHGLRRTSSERSPDAPVLATNQRDAFAATVALMQLARLRDGDMRAIALAIAAGIRRTHELARGGETLDAVASELSMDGWRRRSLRLMIESRSQDAVGSAFSLVELLTLGGGAPGADLDAWGMSALSLEGCVCSRLIGPHRWRLLAGRHQSTLLTAAMPDLNLRVAVMLNDLGLPAALARPVLAAAVLDFTEGVSPDDANDWWTLSRTARELDRHRIEDYVASAAAVDGPLVPLEVEGENPAVLPGRP